MKIAQVCLQIFCQIVPKFLGVNGTELFYYDLTKSLAVQSVHILFWYCLERFYGGL